MLKINIIDAEHGDCILLDFDHSKILIDCGPKSFKTCRSVLANIEKIIGENGVIDIAIVTHNDDDHIGGFERLLDTSMKINTIIFNSLQDIPNIIKNSQKQISYSQDNTLRQKLLEEKGINIQSLIRNDAPLIHRNIKITAITPTVEGIERMLNDFNAREERQRRQKQISSSKTEDISLQAAFQKIQSNQDLFVKDTSITNKSSIGLVVEYGTFSGLFLGDAHVDDVIDGLNIAGFGNHQFDVVKLSHHGSERNTNSELLSLIGKTEYILCANNEKHNHPNNMTLTRILSFNNSPMIHLSSDNASLSAKISECKKLNFNINETYPVNGVNTISYEYE